MKFAVKFVLDETVIVLVAFVFPSDQLENSYPLAGVAVTLTVCPCSYVPPVVFTEPPLDADIVTVYVVFFGGITGPGSPESELQLKSNNPIDRAPKTFMFFIKCLITF